jgi:hypothetical protein
MTFTAIGFPPDGSGWETCTKIGKRRHRKRNNTHNNTKKYKITKYTK